MERNGRLPDSEREPPRRVLIVHNWHRAEAISGENRVVEADASLLGEAGVDVEIYGRSNDEIKDFGPARWAGMALRPTISPTDAMALRRLIARFRPDVVHLHNPMPLISPWVVRTSHTARVPVVQTVHNYLHVCVAGTYYRDGHPCHDCRGRSLPWPAVLHACYHDSRPQSAALALGLAAHRSTWRLVDRFLAVGQAVALHLQQMGIDPNRITVRGNPVADPGLPSPPGEGALFIGRFSAEKGIHLLIEAWKRSGSGVRHTLRLAGNGSDAAAVARAARAIPGIEMLGEVPHARAMDLITASAFVVAPGLWEEPFGLAVVEAMARGRPVLVTTRGEPPHILGPDAGWIVDPTIDAVASGLTTAFDADLRPLADAARRRYLESYSPAAALRTLMRAYTHSA